MVDADPAPPLTILVSRLRLVDGGTTYQMIGSIRNDGSEIYRGIDVVATFFDTEGDRHRVAEVECACRLLVPGDACPFRLEIYADDYVKYKLHPKGVPTQHRHPLTLAVEQANVSRDGAGNVHITGRVLNFHSVTIDHILVRGELLDASGHVVNLDSTALLGDIAPGADAPFDVRIAHEPYVTHRLTAVGIQK
jgi:hypothetical protein